MNSEEFLKQIDLEDKTILEINNGEKICIHIYSPSSLIQHDEIYKILYNTYVKALREHWSNASISEDEFLISEKGCTINHMFDKLFIETLKEVDKLRDEQRETCVIRKRNGYYFLEIDFDYCLMRLDCKHYDNCGITTKCFDGIKICGENKSDE